MQNWQEYSEEIQKFIKEHGIESLQKIIYAIKPFMPVFIQNRDLVPIAFALIGTLIPIAIGSTVFALDTLAKVSMFGVNTGVATAKVTYGVAKTTVQVATNVLIKKPIYILSYPFRKKSQTKQMKQMMELCQLQQGELQKYKKAYGKVINQEPEKLFLIIREIGKQKDIRIMIGSLQRNDKVERLLPIIKKNMGQFNKDSIQLICNKNMLRLDTKLSALPRNEFGAIQIYFTMLQTFG